MSNEKREGIAEKRKRYGEFVDSILNDGDKIWARDQIVDALADLSWDLDNLRRPVSGLREKVKAKRMRYVQLESKSSNRNDFNSMEKYAEVIKVLDSVLSLLTGSEVSVLGEVRKEVEEMPNLKLGRGISRESVLSILDKHAKGRK